MGSASDRYYQLVLDRIGITQTDRKGNISIICPNCKRGNKHFSFHKDNGAFCFGCGYKPTFRQMLQDMTGETSFEVAPEAPRKEPAWKDHALALTQRLAEHPEVVERWQAYKPLPEHLIRERLLGYGVFPKLWHRDGSGVPDWIDPQGGRHWVCDHPRLIVPLIVEGQVVGFRCRSVGCQCPRWLSPRGSKLVLYNGGRIASPNLDSRIGDADPQVLEGDVWICENPIDALLIEAYWGVPAVGTLGVAIWKKSWTEALRERGSVVAFDNDASGNCLTRAALKAWKASHSDAPAPKRGNQLNRLLQNAKVKSQLYLWDETDPVGMDIGDLFVTKGNAKPNLTINLTRWFVDNILHYYDPKRVWTSDDYRSAHSRHAKDLLTRHSLRDICGCLEAMRDGKIGDGYPIKFMSVIESTGEPPMIAQWKAYLDREPEPYLENKHADWVARKDRTYAELEVPRVA